MVSSCKRNTDISFSQNRNISIAEATLTKTGRFVFYPEKNSTGLVNIYKQPDGKYVLALEQMVLNSNRDLELYLSTDKVLTPSAIKLFSFRSVDGSFYYELPGDIDISAFSHVVIQNDIQQQPVASAEIN